MSQILIPAEEMPQGMGTVGQVSQFLSISRPTLYKLLGDGVIPSIKLGGARRIPWAGVARLINSPGGEGA